MGVPLAIQPAEPMNVPLACAAEPTAGGRRVSLRALGGAVSLSSESAVERWVATFRLDPFVHRYVAQVVADLPALVRDDLMSDPNFHLCDYEPAVGGTIVVPMRFTVRARASRSVVLKRTLRHRSQAFVRWLIAHELAHAYLRHGGRTPGEDPEHAADGLAAQWGFPKPPYQAW